MRTKPSSSPLVSIIVPVWNAKQYLDNCINSLRSQTYPNLEIILVDDPGPRMGRRNSAMPRWKPIGVST